MAELMVSILAGVALALTFLNRHVEQGLVREQRLRIEGLNKSLGEMTDLWLDAERKYSACAQQKIGLAAELRELKAKCSKCSGRSWRGHGRLQFGKPIKREDQTVTIEPDEKVEVTLPPIVDDDGDPVVVDRVEWSVDDAGTAFTEPIGDGTAGAWLITTGRLGQVHVKATVYAGDGGNGVYEGDVVVGLSAPVGGVLGFGTPVKREAPPVEG